MKVTVVGTSCTWFKRNNTSFIIDDNILIDTPEGSYKDILKYVDVLLLDAIFITHFHNDHFPDLHIITTRMMRSNIQRKNPLKVFGPKGIVSRLMSLHEICNSSEDEKNIENYNGKVEFIEMQEGAVYEMGRYAITPYRMDHGPSETYGLTFKENGNKTVGFSSDTTDCENLRKLVANSDVSFVDFASVKHHHAHMFIEAFTSLLKDNPTKTIYPVHTSDDTQKYVEENNINPLHDGQILNF